MDDFALNSPPPPPPPKKKKKKKKKEKKKKTRNYVYGTLCPNRCEPSIEALNFGGGGGGGGGGGWIRADVNGEVKFL